MKHNDQFEKKCQDHRQCSTFATANNGRIQIKNVLTLNPMKEGIA